MGEPHVTASTDPTARRRFMGALLDDLRALEVLCTGGALEVSPPRIGAEQEMFLVDSGGRPAPVALGVLEALQAEGYTTEIALWNLEYNLAPLPLRAGALQALEAALNESLQRIRVAAAGLGAEVLLNGTLPSLELTDLTLRHLTPRQRYRALNQAVIGLAGGLVRTHITGTDELQLAHDNVLLEGANCSLQVHLQVDPPDFARLYNLAQVISAPVLAVAVNAPFLLQRRLWHETRIAVFQQTLNIEGSRNPVRSSWQRVAFGHRWVDDSVIELFREQVARHRVLLVAEDLGRPSTDLVARGEVPALRALCLHNGSVYRWNRACYGVLDGRPHLRIEHRPLPAGPTVLDQTSNAALFFGLMTGLRNLYPDVRTAFRFADARTNFLTAARYGLKAQFRWAHQKVVSAQQLLLEELLPAARHGLLQSGIPAAEADRYLGVIEQRVLSGMSGAQWQLEAWERLAGATTPVVRSQALVRAVVQRQWSGVPVHSWSLPDPAEARLPGRARTVGQVMSTALFTVGPDDPLALAASLMSWHRFHHVPVEGRGGRLVGILTPTHVLRAVRGGLGDAGAVPVRQVMEHDPPVATPDMTCAAAARRMLAARTDGLPVILDGHLVGIVSERDLLLRWVAAGG